MSAPHDVHVDIDKFTVELVGIQSYDSALYMHCTCRVFLVKSKCGHAMRYSSTSLVCSSQGGNNEQKAIYIVTPY